MKIFLIISSIIVVIAGVGVAVKFVGMPVYYEHISPQSQKVYTWTDENGVVHFSDVPFGNPGSDDPSEITEKQYKDYGRDKYYVETEEESARPTHNYKITKKQKKRSSSKGFSLSSLWPFGNRNWERKRNDLLQAHKEISQRNENAAREYNHLSQQAPLIT